MSFFAEKVKLNQALKSPSCMFGANLVLYKYRGYFSCKNISVKEYLIERVAIRRCYFYLQDKRSQKYLKYDPDSEIIRFYEEGEKTDLDHSLFIIEGEDLRAVDLPPNDISHINMYRKELQSVADVVLNTDPPLYIFIVPEKYRESLSYIMQGKYSKLETSVKSIMTKNIPELHKFKSTIYRSKTFKSLYPKEKDLKDLAEDLDVSENFIEEYYSKYTPDEETCLLHGGIANTIVETYKKGRTSKYVE